MKQKLIIPKGYESALSTKKTQVAIFKLKRFIEEHLTEALDLTMVQCPLMVRGGVGINDDLNGSERPVSFDLEKSRIEIVQSLAKWKRMALEKYDLGGLCTNMHAIRRDEETIDNIHSFTVDQWDWEKAIERCERTEEFLKGIVRKIYEVYRKAMEYVIQEYPEIGSTSLPEDIFFITTQELEDRYPSLTPKERESRICELEGAVFIQKIGAALKSGIKHDGRAPDYDDHELNGDICFWFPTLGIPFELSSMGIRVDEKSLMSQLKREGAESRLQYEYHTRIMKKELPLSIGGGIGVSRSLQFLLSKAHIGEVQCSVWPDGMRKKCELLGIHLL